MLSARQSTLVTAIAIALLLQHSTTDLRRVRVCERSVCVVEKESVHVKVLSRLYGVLLLLLGLERANATSNRVAAVNACERLCRGDV